MIAADEDALICDLAETYHILDYKALPLRLAATLAAGLPLYSRSKSGDSCRGADLRLLICARAADRLGEIEWMLAGMLAGNPDTDRPASLTAALLGQAPEEASGGITGFDSPEELMTALYGETKGGKANGSVD